MASAWRAIFQSHDSAGVIYINTIGVKMDPVSGSGLSPSDLATHVNTWLGGTYRGILGAGLTLDTVTVDSFPTPGDQGVHAVNLPGNVTEDHGQPRELCAIFAWKTDVATRSGRGHIAFPLPQANGIINASTLLASSAWQTSAAAFFAALDAGHDWGGPPAEGHLSHVVLSKKNSAYYDVKTRIVRPSIRWIERRQTAP